MESDWELEIGGGAPVIEASWPGFVDLRTSPEQAIDLPESAQLPGLAEALIQMNRPGSPVWTAKCDVWPIPNPAELDPYEMNAAGYDCSKGIACYIDLLPTNHLQWSTPETADAWARNLCSLLHSIPLSNCRTDLVIRKAWLTPGPEAMAATEAIAITAYLTACGPSVEAAKNALRAALAALADALTPSRR